MLIIVVVVGTWVNR